MLVDLNDDLLARNNKLNVINNLNSLHQIIDKLTRVTPQTATLLDSLVTNRLDTILLKDVIPSDIADHDLITATVNITKPKRKPVMKTLRHLDAYSKDVFCDALLTATPALNVISSTDDVDFQARTLTSVHTNCFDYFDPLVTTVIKKPFAPWINDEFREVMATGNTLQARLKLDRRNAILQDQYKLEKNIVKSLLRTNEQI